MLSRLRLVLFAAVCQTALGQSPSDLNFLTSHVDGRDRTAMLGRYLRNKAYIQLDARAAAVAGIRDRGAMEARGQTVRDELTALLGGPFPDKTPLNARITGRLDFPGYSVEKVIFESQPGFPVTASLYLPKSGAAPHPAILFPLGHEAGAKANEAWQAVLVTFARRGYVCLAWDTIGQGERIQLWDEDFTASKVVRSTTEHTIVGLQTVLVGDPLARYTIWDGVRAMDYLLSRPEVDPKRVGVTGNSGGGTHTAYLSAVDGSRFAAAAPSCYLTSWRRLLDTIGPQDAEQCIPGFLSAGLDHPDFVFAFAPKPYRMLTAIRDFFSIEGARATAAEMARIYDAAGAGDRFGQFEADDGHGYTLPRRESAYRFFSRWLEGKEDPRPEAPVAYLSERELWCTRTGQVATEFPRSETVFSLNQARLAQVRRPGATREQVRTFTAFAPATGTPRVTGYGAAASFEKLTYQSEPGIEIPALLYLPQGSGRHAAAILAHGRGKSAAHEQALKLKAAGKAVLSIDLRGMGETAAVFDGNGSDWPRYFGNYEAAMTAMLTGKPLVTMRAEDIARAIDLLVSRAEVDPGRIELHGIGAAAVPALYAAAFDTRIAATTLEGMVVSYESVVRSRIHRGQWENAVPGALRLYDLPDLIRWVAPRAITVTGSVDPMGNPAAAGPR
jgi:cephalosporin-C deacetylase-like acetyl esterase